MMKPPAMTNAMLCRRSHQIARSSRDAIGAIEPGAQRLDAVGGEPQRRQDAEGQETALAPADHFADRRRQRSATSVRHEVEHLLDEVVRGFPVPQKAGERGEEDQEREQGEEGGERDVARQLQALVVHDQAPGGAIGILSHSIAVPIRRSIGASGSEKSPARRAPAEHRARSAVAAGSRTSRCRRAPRVNIASAAPIAYRDRRGSCAGRSRGSRPTSPGGKFTRIGRAQFGGGEYPAQAPAQSADGLIRLPVLNEGESSAMASPSRRDAEDRWLGAPSARAPRRWSAIRPQARGHPGA